MINVRRFSLVSDQIEYAELEVILKELAKVIRSDVPGSVVEFGCYEGTTSLFIQRLLNQSTESREFHVYDSFSGLPEKTPLDNSPAGEQFKAGELVASKNKLIKHFKQAGLPLPIIHKGWFEHLTARDLPKSVAFAFLDGDFYSSISASLKHLTPLLSKGAVLVVDDYQSEALPGAQKAVNEWVRRHSLSMNVQESLAIITWHHA